MLTIIGLKHCTTIQKAKKYLENQGLEFHEITDIRENLPSSENRCKPHDKGKQLKVRKARK